MPPAPASSAPPFPPGKPPHTRYAPDQQALATAPYISDADVLAVIDMRGGQAYSASVNIGLANRFPLVSARERQQAIQRALKSGAVVCTPLGAFRRPPRADE